MRQPAAVPLPDRVQAKIERGELMGIAHRSGPWKAWMTLTCGVGVWAASASLATAGEPSTPTPAESGEVSTPAGEESILPISYRPDNSDRSRSRSTSASDRVQTLGKGSSQRSSRKKAIDALPLNRLAAPELARARKVLADISLYRELPTLAFPVHPEVYEFFAAHPDVAVSIWRVMGISKFEMWQTDRWQYEADAGDGTTGIIDVLYKDRGQALVVCDGVFTSPLLSKPLEAHALLHLKFNFVRTRDGETYVKHHVTMFAAFPSQAVGAAAKVISPVSNMIIDRNFEEISLFLHMMSLAMARQPGWMEQVARRMEGVLDERRVELRKLTARVYVEARRREAELRAQQPQRAVSALPAPVSRAPRATSPDTGNRTAGTNTAAN